MTDAVAAYGTLIKFGDGGDPESFTAVAEISNISGPGFSMDTAEVTHHESIGAFKEFVGTLLDGGEVTLEGNWLPANATQGLNASGSLMYAYMNRTVDNYQIVWPDSGSTEWTFAALVTNIEPGSDVSDKSAVSFTLKVTGQPTFPSS